MSKNNRRKRVYLRVHDEGDRAVLCAVALYLAARRVNPALPPIVVPALPAGAAGLPAPAVPVPAAAPTPSSGGRARPRLLDMQRESETAQPPGREQR